MKMKVLKLVVLIWDGMIVDVKCNWNYLIVFKSLKLNKKNIFK